MTCGSQPRRSRPIRPDLLQAEHQTAGQVVAAPDVGVAWSGLLGEDDHAHPSGLAVAVRMERRHRRLTCRLTHDLLDGGPLAGGAPAEERERDVQVIPRKPSHAGSSRELPLLPGHETVDHVQRQAQRDEKTETVTAAEASSAIHPACARDRDRTSRM